MINGRPPMPPVYRCYLLDDNAHIIRAVDLGCRNDDEALQAGTRWFNLADNANGKTIEIRDKARLVAKRSRPWLVR
jgi:hypothetical protein